MEENQNYQSKINDLYTNQSWNVVCKETYTEDVFLREIIFSNE